MESELFGIPIWGAMPKKLAVTLSRVTNGRFSEISPEIVKVIMNYPSLIHSFGFSNSDSFRLSSDGGIMLNTVSGPMVKYLVANKDYYRRLLREEEDKVYNYTGRKRTIHLALLTALKSFLRDKL